MLVWIDCEMTGLDLAHDELIEVACLVTDGELTIQGEGVDVLIKPSDAAMANMGEFVTEMHTTSGLLEELKTCTTTMREAEEQVLAYIKQYVPEPRKAPLAGNTIGTDRTFLAKDMPELEGYVHYRNVDVSSIKELARRWYPRTFFNAPAKNGNHRALADIMESIEELMYYRGAVMVPEPGPTADEARAIAARCQGRITGFGRTAE
ncbi:oligoribonuclease [Propionibacterium australiense]|uniref:Oligoribonuclease n=1 Tax=Propionibacterium australiense TaxID=119981 RepID=A0A383S960_9ACTN|nr:oligoribonuclease [Propionibacterium australiense]RLP06442.1 oligoribonuclease [Propionibacterium australiense]RLP06850.1 oligoribonuclease [Propionibacterium australiense]SYZ34447.1 Ribonuclease H-like domain [Propionibacterium australiense]VEH90023.1 Oligoribonuclease [Propionibacterium australiense]